jgi:hypothetical protein
LQLEAIAKLDHVEGRGWYGLRRIAADLAETATTDDRVKDRLGGWQDSETRKQTYQDRQADEPRAERPKGRRWLRLGANPNVNGTCSLDLDAFFGALTPEQQALLAAKTSASTGPKKKSPLPVRIPATAASWNFKASSERAMGLEPTTSSLGSRQKQCPCCVVVDFLWLFVHSGTVRANGLARNQARTVTNGDQR